ncbi:CMGC kinase [Fusarium circinatum]|uniref:CMGC kinase n=1 Tax=Fusarium circinatum TaxID=48490 RepID=A0A8H5UB61_FUSCI|nr:CMGC kinase [Fusarium circinatum]
MGSISTSTQGAPDSQLVLSDALWRERVPHINGENYFFWPYPILKRLITRETIIRQLDTVKIGLEDAEACSDVILGTDKTSFLRVFAILAIVERSGDIQALIDADLHDERFPLVQRSEHHLTAQICMAKLGWSHMQRDYFNINQLRMSPRFFALEEEYEAQHYDMPKGQMLPWVLCRDSYGVHEETLSGGCGQVVKYKIDADSHGFAPLLEKLGFYGSFVAVKSLKDTHKEQGAPNKELEMLKQFSGFSHPNIITLLATYTLHNRSHFIFPAAEYDLLMYWKIHPGPLVNPASVNSEGLLWLSGQIRNIVGALAHIHEGKKAHMNMETMFGRHGDIKPANILWFRSRKEQRGVFVISDFGIADAHREETRSIIPAADLPVTPRYRAPECDIRDGRISRAYDVWSLGCVLLEMACWILGANELREQFKEILMSPYITGVKTDIYFDIHWLGPGEGYRLGVKEQIIQADTAVEVAAMNHNAKMRSQHLTIAPRVIGHVTYLNLELMFATQLESGSELGIRLDGGDTYIPGNTITGLVRRTTHIVSPESTVTVSMIGTANTIQLVKDRRGDYAWGVTLPHHRQTLFRGLLLIENGGYKEWSFNISVPLYTDPKVNNGKQALTYVPPDATDHELPPSYILGDGGE